MKDILRKNILAIYPIEFKGLEEFLACTVIKEYPSKQLLVTEGKTAKKLYYIIKGSAKAYLLKDGKEIITWFTLENDVATSIL